MRFFRFILYGFVIVSALGFGFQKVGLVDFFKMGPRLASLYADDPYSVAWVAYQGGQLEKAEVLGKKICQEGGTNLVDALILLGHISQKYGEYSESFDYYNSAAQKAEAEEQFKKLYYTLYCLADLSLDMGDRGRCEDFLEESKSLMMKYGTREVDELQVIIIEKDLLVHQGSLQEASHVSLDLIQEFLSLGFKGQAARVLSDLGMIEIRQGNYLKGGQRTLEAQRVFLELGDLDGYYYNLINFIALEFCRSGNIHLYEEQLLKFSSESKNKEILIKLDNVFAMDCPIDSGSGGFISDGDKPPPPDDPPGSLRRDQEK